VGWAANGPVPAGWPGADLQVAGASIWPGFHLQHRLETCLLPVVTVVVLWFQLA